MIIIFVEEDGKYTQYKIRNIQLKKFTEEKTEDARLFIDFIGSNNFSI